MTPARLSISGSDFVADRSVDFIKAVRGCVAQSARNLCDAERHGIIKCCQKSSPNFECMPGWGHRALSSDGNRLLCGGYVRERRSQRSIEARNRNIQVSSDSQQVFEFVSYDFIGGGLAQFDIADQTGPNSSIFPDQTWPVSNSISLGSLSLTVFYTGGGQFTYGSGYFTLEPDGLSWAGPQVPDSTLFSSATLTGTFNPTLFDLNDGSHFNANVNFTATISDPNNLQNGDFAIIYATPAGGTTPEPGTLVLMGTGEL